MQAERILGTHPIVRAIAGAAERLGRSGHPVVVVGERGTGKELFARHLHAAAGRPEERFIRVDCAEPSERRLEQDLFEREGGWRRAVNGTLLLDGLSSLPLELQQRLLNDCQAPIAAATRSWSPAWIGRSPSSAAPAAWSTS